MKDSKTKRSIAIGEGKAVIQTPRILVEKIESTVFSAIIEKESTDSEPDFTINIKNGQYSLNQSDSSRIVVENQPELLFELEWRIVDLLVNANKNFLQLHSAAMDYEKQGYLFIGEGGSGKTSLSILLGKNGFKFISDEIGILEINKYQLQPFPRNLIIKPYLTKYMDIEEELTIPIDGQKDKVEAYFVSPEKYTTIEKSNKISVDKIFFLSAKDDQTCKINKIGDVEAVNRLLYFSFNKSFHSDKMLSIVSGLVEEAETYKLELSNPLGKNHEQQSQLVEKIKQL